MSRRGRYTGCSDSSSVAYMGYGSAMTSGANGSRSLTSGAAVTACYLHLRVLLKLPARGDPDGVKMSQSVRCRSQHARVRRVPVSTEAKTKEYTGCRA